MKLATIVGLIILALLAISCTPKQEADGGGSAQITDPTPIPSQVPELPDPEEDQEPAPEQDPQQPDTDQQEDADQAPAPEQDSQQPNPDQQEEQNQDQQQPDMDQQADPAESEAPVGQEIELDDVENPPGTNLMCSQSWGCFFTPMNEENLELLDPEEDFFEPDDVDDATFERVICIRGDSCYFTDLTEEDIEILDQDLLFTAHSDADLIGNWQVTNHPTTSECFDVITGLPNSIFDMETELPTSIQDGVIFEVDGNLVGGGLTDDDVDLTFTKIWYGTYMSYLQIPSDQGSIDFTYYLALQDDDNFTGFFTSSIKIDDTAIGDFRCEVIRDFDAARISP
jgi:flagellar motor protein MotB